MAANRFVEAWDAQAADPENFARPERFVDWMQERVVRAGTAITLTQPQSMAGVVAKAEAFQAVQESGWKHCAAGWRDDLAASMPADVLRIGAA